MNLRTSDPTVSIITAIRSRMTRFDKIAEMFTNNGGFEIKKISLAIGTFQQLIFLLEAEH